MSTAFHASRPIPSLFDLSMGQNVIQWITKEIMEQSTCPERMVYSLEKDSLKYHQKVWHTDLLCPEGGEYQWNKKFQNL